MKELVTSISKIQIAAILTATTILKKELPYALKLDLVKKCIEKSEANIARLQDMVMSKQIPDYETDLVGYKSFSVIDDLKNIKLPEENKGKVDGHLFIAGESTDIGKSSLKDIESVLTSLSPLASEQS